MTHRHEDLSIDMPLTHPPGDELMSSGEALGPPTISEPLPSQLQQSSPPGEELAEATRRTPDVEETGSPTPLVFVMQGMYCIQLMISYRHKFLASG